MYNSKISPTIITGQQYGTKVSVEIDHADTDITELFAAFKTICIGLGYSESSWKSVVLDNADEYNDDHEKKIDKYVANLPEEYIDEALIEHNMNEEEFNDYGMRLNKTK